VFNEFNSRTLFHEPNVFNGILGNQIFMGVIAVTVIVQSVLVQFAGEFLGTAPLNATEWSATVGIGAVSIIVGVIARWDQ
jgi:Ca2+-transporting ATPase